MNTCEPVDWNEKAASVTGNTITVKKVNGVNVGTTKDGGVWIALLGGVEQAHRIAAIINLEAPDLDYVAQEILNIIDDFHCPEDDGECITRIRAVLEKQ